MRLSKDLNTKYSFTEYTYWHLEGIYIGSRLSGYSLNGNDIGYELYKSGTRQMHTFYLR